MVWEGAKRFSYNFTTMVTINYYSFFLKYLFQESCVQTSRSSNPPTNSFLLTKSQNGWEFRVARVVVQPNHLEILQLIFSSNFTNLYEASRSTTCQPLTNFYVVKIQNYNFYYFKKTGVWFKSDFILICMVFTVMTNVLSLHKKSFLNVIRDQCTRFLHASSSFLRSLWYMTVFRFKFKLN